jgi:hypothetical protein
MDARPPCVRKVDHAAKFLLQMAREAADQHLYAFIAQLNHRLTSLLVDGPRRSRGAHVKRHNRFLITLSVKNLKLIIANIEFWAR